MPRDEEWLAASMGVGVRPARGGDYAEIEAMARASFPVPVWLFEHEENLEHYRASWRPASADGTIRVLVARNRLGRLCGYAYCQPRDDGDLYLKELASRPPDPADRVPLAGTLLLAFALRLGIRRGCRRATLSVIEPHRRPAPSGVRWRDPVPYYLRLGYRIGDIRRGYTSAGPPVPDDTWMTAPLRPTLRRILAALESQAASPIAAAGPLRCASPASP